MFSLHSSSRSARPAALALAAGALATLLAGCKSQSPGSETPPAAGGAGGAPAAPGAPRGDLTFSSAETGTLTLASSKCTFAGGKPTGFDGSASSGSVSGTASGKAWKVRLTTSARPAGYTADGQSGVTTTQSGDMWKVTLSGVKLTAADQPGTVLQVSGTVICSSTD